jgi:hypothetical protein
MLAEGFKIRYYMGEDTSHQPKTDDASRQGIGVRRRGETNGWLGFLRHVKKQNKRNTPENRRDARWHLACVVIFLPRETRMQDKKKGDA